MTQDLPEAKNPPLRMFVVEDDEAFRRSVCATIARDEGLVLAAQANSVESAKLAMANIDFDVALVDLGLPDGSGIEVIRKISSTRPEVDIMVITVFGDEAHVLSSIEAGATGYLLKRNLPDTLSATVNDLRAGGSPISPVIARQLLQRFKTPTEDIAEAPTTAEPGGLSEREREVLQYISKGFTVGEIASMLQLSAHTVATHVKRIYRKLAVHSRTEAVYEAGRMGLL